MTTVTISPYRDRDILSGRSRITEPGGTEWESSWTHDWSLLLMLDGCGAIHFGGEELAVSKGDLVLIAPEHPHRFRCEGVWEILWFHFLMRPHMLPLSWLEWREGVRSCRLAGPDFLHARTALLEAFQLDHRRPAGWYPLAYTLLESALLRGRGDGTAEERNQEAWLARAQKILLAPGEGVSMDRIAAHCGMSRTRFYTEFKRLCGQSPRVYRELGRLRRAQLLLESTTLPVAGVARQVGVEDSFYFASRFRRFCGETPSQYRKRLQQKE